VAGVSCGENKVVGATSLEHRLIDSTRLLIVGGADRECPNFDISDRSACEALYRSQRGHFWFASRNLAIVRFLRRVGLLRPSRFLEVGCGTGTVLAHLIKHGYRADGADMHLELCRRAARFCPQARVYCLDVIRDDTRRLSHDYQVVGLFDVLEHVDDTSALLSACVELTESDGLIVGTVPALMGLWSTMDDVSGHRCRYDRSTLRRAVETAGLEVVLIEYFFQALVPMIWLHRTCIADGGCEGHARCRKVVQQAIKVPPSPLNAALRAICFVERALARPLPLGLLPGASLFFACRRR